MPRSATTALLLDITRLVRRAGRTPTGIDRAERAYFDRFLSLSLPVFFLCRTSLGYILLDQAGGKVLQGKLKGVSPWGHADFPSRVLSKMAPEVQRAESDLRRLCIARASRFRLGSMLRRTVPDGTRYFNVGHSNLDNRTLNALSCVGIRINVLIHDVIPLEFPQFQKPGSVDQFRRRLAAAQKYAHRLIYNSDDTRDRVEQHMKRLGDVPSGMVAHLGVTLPDAGGASFIPIPDAPFFLAVGTIEPRKAYDLLLDVWEDMIRERGAESVPRLIICGSRGWNNDAVFQRLDAVPPDGPVVEIAGLDDGTIAALMTQSLGLLFPSHAEGYGLPPLEAAALGCPVVCRDLKIFRELLGNIPVYVESGERYQWRSIIERLEAGELVSSGRLHRPQFNVPKWDDHFNAVLSLD